MASQGPPKAQDEWTVVVPALPVRDADNLWHEWCVHAAMELRPDDVRVDVIRAEDGDLRRYRVRGLTLVDCDDLVASLRQLGGEIERIVEDHRVEYDVVLLHLLVADLRRFAEDAFEMGSNDRLDRLLGLLAQAFEHADSLVQNAIAVSFVEDSCPWEPAASAFVATWPDPLQREARRQLDWRS